MKRMVLIAGVLLTCAGCVSRPAFLPTTTHLYAAFSPLDQPKPDVPVGALWVAGYGPVGEGAAADNLVTERSLSAITFDSDFQASLTLGLLKFLDLDPSLRTKVTARFTDLTIVRIKDWSRLSGPAEQPRLYEALRAGTISVTSTSDVGLDIENRAISQNLPVFGRGTTGVARTFNIDGKDLIFAIHVAALEQVEGARISIEVRPNKTTMARLGGERLLVHPDVSAGCVSKVTVKAEAPARSNLASFDLEVPLDGDERAHELHLPRSNKSSVLLTSLVARGHLRGCNAALSLWERGSNLRTVAGRASIP